MVKIKICGLKRLEDIELANRYKIDYAGFVFAESKRNKFSPAIYEARKMSPLPLTVVLKFIEKLMLKT